MREPPRDLQLVERDQPLLMGIAQMREHLPLRALGQPHTIGKSNPIAGGAHDDEVGATSNGVYQSINMAKVAPEVRRQQKQVDAKIELVSKLPGSGVGDVGVRSHARA